MHANGQGLNHKLKESLAKESLQLKSPGQPYQQDWQMTEWKVSGHVQQEMTKKQDGHGLEHWGDGGEE